MVSFNRKQRFFKKIYVEQCSEFMHFDRVAALTSLWALVELVHEGERVLDNIQDRQQSARETQQLAKAVEAEVDQVTGQIHHLEERGKTQNVTRRANVRK